MLCRPRIDVRAYGPYLVAALSALLILSAGPSLAMAQGRPTTVRAAGAKKAPAARRPSAARPARARPARAVRKPAAARKRGRKKKVTVPVEIGVGPAFLAFANPFGSGNFMQGPLTEDQFFHYGLRLEMAAIIDHEFIRQNPRLVPRKYRKYFKPGSEFRYTPGVLALVPREIIISPKTGDTGIYGATWKLLGIGVSLARSNAAHLSLGAGLLATYAYIDSDIFDSPTHFLRPGVSLGLEAGTMLGDSFGLSVGWDSNFYIPQALGGGVFEIGEGDQSLWHIGELYVLLRFRFPYTTTL